MSDNLRIKADTPQGVTYHNRLDVDFQIPATDGVSMVRGSLVFFYDTTASYNPKVEFQALTTGPARKLLTGMQDGNEGVAPDPIRVGQWEDPIIDTTSDYVYEIQEQTKLEISDDEWQKFVDSLFALLDKEGIIYE